MGGDWRWQKVLARRVALVFGSGLDAIAKAAFEYGADEVFVADDAALTDYRAEPYASTLSALASSPTPDLILFPTTTRTRELAAMSAVDLIHRRVDRYLRTRSKW